MQPPGAAEAPQAAAPEVIELQVVTTFLPITQFARVVVGDRAEVAQLISANLGPHDYQAAPADVQNLAQADVLVINGHFGPVPGSNCKRAARARRASALAGVRPVFDGAVGGAAGGASG
jgi:hypothetical protein